MLRRNHTPRPACRRSALTLAGAASALLLAAGSAAAQTASDENPSGYVGPASAQGEDSVAVGSEAQANGDYSLAVGVGAVAGFEAEDRFATAVGFEAQAGFWSTAVGTYAEALGETSSAFGYGATAYGESSTALGGMSTADGMWSTAVGGGWAVGDQSIAIGMGAQTDAYGTGGDRAIVIGSGGLASGHDSIAMGYMSITDGDRAMALGASADLMRGHVFGALADEAVAVGYGAFVMGERSVAVGVGSVAMDDDVFSIGRGDDDLYGRAAFTRRLINVSDGQVAENSADAVTGGQLFTTRHALASALGGGAGFDAAGLFSAPSFTILGSTYNNVSGALGALNTQVETNVADIEEIKTAGGVGPGGGPDDHTAEIAALRAQVEALNSALDRLEQGAISGSAATGEGATAAGEGAVATQYGDTAFGAGAHATGDPSTAIGFAALASGQHSTAIGGNAEASGNLSVALGQGAVASGESSLALGQGASAVHDKAVAIGQGVATTRANQVAIGSADHTYTLAGVGSQASLAAQSGPVRMVTADAGGNLATLDMRPWFDRVDALEGRMDAFDERWRVADESFDRHADGVATALALGGAQVLQPGQSFAMSANVGHFDGAGAVGFGAVGRLNSRVSVNIGLGAGFRTGTMAGRAGISVGW